jgi:hypothetical protein
MYLKDTKVFECFFSMHLGEFVVYLIALVVYFNEIQCIYNIFECVWKYLSIFEFIWMSIMWIYSVFQSPSNVLIGYLWYILMHL